MTLAHLRSMPNLRKVRAVTPTPPVPPDPEINVVTLPLGDGTELNPYIIRYFGNLRWVSDNTASWDKYFIQVRNIDAVYSLQLDSGAGFDPIGNNSNKFTGYYDGDEYSVSNLYINRPTEDYVGLFGYSSRLNGISIKDLFLVGVNITGKSFVGGLAGKVIKTTINDCYTTGSVVCTWGSSGGMIGVSNEGIFNRCHSLCTVAGVSSYTGGFIGQCASSVIINNSYSIGNVSGGGAVGGFAGNLGNGSVCNQCYCSGTVSGTGTAYGFVGAVTLWTTPATGCYYDSAISGKSDAMGGSAPKTTAQMKLEATFVDWNFTTIWAIDALINSGYPYLRD